MNPRPSSKLDHVAGDWRPFISDQAEKTYILELQVRNKLMSVYAKTDNKWAKKYAQEALTMPFGYLRELKLTVIRCMCNLRNWSTTEGKQLRYELRQLLEKINLR